MKTSVVLQKGSTVFLRIVVSIIALGVLAICIFVLPAVWTDAYNEYPSSGFAIRAIVAGMYMAAIPFYFGVYKGLGVLNAIDKNKPFSLYSVRALHIISLCAGIISLIFAIDLPFFYIWADNTDAPGLMMIGLFFLGMPLIISVAIGLLRRLLIEAVTIKSENELTV